MRIPRECKRLAEVDFPIAVVSKHAVYEKSLRSGHPSNIHLWWARRPLASCRAVLLALLLPDPCEETCPPEFKAQARELLARVQARPGSSDTELRQSLLKFIGDFASWELSANQRYIDAGRGLVHAAHPEETPLVVDPFAGGGAIPLEALRLGCEAFASDLNPVACLILKVLLEDIPRLAPDLAHELRSAGRQIKEAAEQELAEFYPPDPDGGRPIAYIWARTVRCETPGCGAEIPLVRSFWLSTKANRGRALRYRVERPAGAPPRVEFEVFTPNGDGDVPPATVSRAKATCPACRAVLASERVRAQLHDQRGGADVAFDNLGIRIGGARLLAVVTVKPTAQGRHYRVSQERDYAAVHAAVRQLSHAAAGSRPGGLSIVPDEPMPPIGTLGFRVQRYGMLKWGDLFSARQALALHTLSSLVAGSASDARVLLALAIGKVADLGNAAAPWKRDAECPVNLLGSQRIRPPWDWAEAVVTSEASGSFASAFERTAAAISAALSFGYRSGTVAQGDAKASFLPEASADVWFTDPPYYNAIPYAHLSDFFFVWLKRTLPGNQLMRDPSDASNTLTPKEEEIVQDDVKIVGGRSKDKAFFESSMRDAFEKARQVVSPGAVGSVVFAHKTTEGWEALLSGLTAGGWKITASWPIATEMASRPRARESAALTTSVHLICRPRPEDAPVGDWADVLRQLPIGVGRWMQRLQTEGVRGADLVFACIGPALEIYSRYSKVVDAEDREIPLGGDPEATDPYRRGYLAYVWETVGRAALQQILGQDEGAGALEEDARLVALFLWTLQSTNGGNNGAHDEEEPEEDDSAGEEDEDEDSPGRKPKGYTLIFDVARRFAQPLGIHLPDWEGRVIETKKGVVRLLPVAERAKQLFGEDGAQAAADRIEKEPASAQLSFFPEMQAESKPRRGRRKVTITASDESISQNRNATTLDRLHIAMLLQSSGRANALRALLAAEQQRGPEFLRLANALSALYPRESEEKRLLDAMLLALPR